MYTIHLSSDFFRIISADGWVSLILTENPIFVSMFQLWLANTLIESVTFSQFCQAISITF